MKNKKLILGIAFVLVFVCSMTACSGGGKTLNNAEELKAYLDSQPDNSPDNPIKVTMKAKDLDFPKIKDAIISSSGKYVSLNLSGSPIKTIPDEAFSECTGLTSVTIPNSVTSIGNGTFRFCTSLTSVTIGNKVTTIGNRAFERCSSLTSITIPNSVTKIGEAAFEYCESLTSITIGNKVTTIGYRAFTVCDITSITIPNSVTSIGNYAFDICRSLTAINVDSGNSAYSSQDGILFNKDKTELIRYPPGKTGEYTIPNSVTKIEGSAFLDCGNLTSVTFQCWIPLPNQLAFEFGLHREYLARGIGTYKTTAPVGDNSKWTKQ